MGPIIVINSFVSLLRKALVLLMYATAWLIGSNVNPRMCASGGRGAEGEGIIILLRGKML